MHRSRWVAGVVSIVVAALISVAPSSASAAPLPPNEDPFYTYSGTKPLADYAPGEVLKTRTGTATLAVPNIAMTQLLYRTRDQLGRPVATVATVLKPLVPNPALGLLSYQSFYDALTTRCEPSYTLNGGPTNGTWTAEQHFIEGLLVQGYTLVVSDFESQDPAFGTGPIYGYETLDGIRATFNSTEVNLAANTKVGMVGYSGGAIATEWATELAPEYAPDVNDRLVGSAFGGVFVHPMHNLHYVDGSDSWSSVMPTALVGIAKAFELDLTPYLSDYGKELVETVKNDCIFEHNYPNLTFAQLVKPEFAQPESIPEFVETANALIMGTGGTPTVPMMIRQGTDALNEEGTQPSPQYGPGDGVMLAADVRSLARKYCDYGVPVSWLETPLGHTNEGIAFVADASAWLATRFAGLPAPTSCGSIPAGNSLAPTPVPPGPPGNPPGTTPGLTPGSLLCDGKLVTVNLAKGQTPTAGNDVIAGTAGKDVIRASGGNDIVCAGGGADRVDGGTGRDRLFGERGRDRLSGGRGSDQLFGGPGRDRFSSGVQHR